MQEKFPDRIFNGTHAQRPDLSTVKGPDHLDYILLSKELQAVQEYLLNLASNTTLMPNLTQALEEAYQQIKNLKAEVSKVTPPKVLKAALETLQAKVEEIDCRKQLANIQSELLTIKDSIAKNQLQMLQLQRDFAQDVKGFQNKLTNQFQKLEKEANKRLDDTEERLDKVNTQAEISNLLSKLEKFK
ncbi:MAG: hypothetical protein M0Q12_07995 [Synergistaceae bacterium]|jgi:hypothetical protein|nr:hypothetical protein [Synergistaceae bacterium]